MDNKDLKALVKSLSDPKVAKLLKHKDWDAAYAKMVDNEDEHVEGFYDLSDDVQFVHILEKYCPEVMDGKIWIEDTVPTEPYYWHAGNGDWQQESDDEDEEEEDEDEGPTSGEEDGPE